MIWFYIFVLADIGNWRFLFPESFVFSNSVGKIDWRHQIEIKGARYILKVLVRRDSQHHRLWILTFFSEPTITNLHPLLHPNLLTRDLRIPLLLLCFGIVWRSPHKLSLVLLDYGKICEILLDSRAGLILLYIDVAGMIGQTCLGFLFYMRRRPRWTRWGHIHLLYGRL